MTDLQTPTRRGFLKLSAVAGVVAASPALALQPDIPRLYGDGVADDTKALQALLDGKPVYAPKHLVSRADGAVLRLTGGTYKISDTLFVRETSPEIDTRNNIIEAQDLPEGRPILHFDEGVSGGKITGGLWATSKWLTFNR